MLINRRLFIFIPALLIAGLLPLPALSLDPVGGIKLQTPVFILPPSISSVSPSCVRKGATLTIMGNNFGAQSGRAVALSGPSHADLMVSSWSNNSIAATVPNTSQVLAGKQYSVGIEKSGHAGWLSNTNVSVTICSELSILLPGIRLISPVIKPGPGTERGTEDGTDGGGTPDPGAAAPAPGAPALLGSQLPPPPADLPPPLPRHDKRTEPGEIVVVSANMAEAQALQQHAQGLGLGVKRRTVLKDLRARGDGPARTERSQRRQCHPVTAASAAEHLGRCQPSSWIARRQFCQLRTTTDRHDEAGAVLRSRRAHRPDRYRRRYQPPGPAGAVHRDSVLSDPRRDPGGSRSRHCLRRPAGRQTFAKWFQRACTRREALRGQRLPPAGRSRRRHHCRVRGEGAQLAGRAECPDHQSQFRRPPQPAAGSGHRSPHQTRHRGRGGGRE